MLKKLFPWLFKAKFGYVSEHTSFLNKLDYETPKTPSQQAEIDQYRELNEQRDNPDAKSVNPKIWGDF